MALDTTEHAPEIAGLVGIIAVIVPWSVSFSSGGYSGFVAFRFVFGSLQFAFGARAADIEQTVLSVTELGGFYGGDLARVATLWFIAAALLIVALLLGFALLVAGERVTVGPFDGVRLMGALCLCMALLLSGATWLLWQHSARLPIPIGIVVLYFAGANLLVTDWNRMGRSGTETSG